MVPSSRRRGSKGVNRGQKRGVLIRRKDRAILLLFTPCIAMESREGFHGNVMLSCLL